VSFEGKKRRGGDDAFPPGTLNAKCKKRKKGEGGKKEGPPTLPKKKKKRNQGAEKPTLGKKKKESDQGVGGSFPFPFLPRERGGEGGGREGKPALLSGGKMTGKKPFCPKKGGERENFEVGVSKGKGNRKEDKGERGVCLFPSTPTLG